MTSALAGRRLLLVEDDYLIAASLAQALSTAGAKVIGPAGSVAAALDLLGHNEQVDGAVVDLNLKGEMAFPVVDALMERQIPFVLATGYDQSAIPPSYGGTPRCEKPVDPRTIARALFG